MAGVGALGVEAEHGQRGADVDAQEIAGAEVRLRSATAATFQGAWRGRSTNDWARPPAPRMG